MRGGHPALERPRPLGHLWYRWNPASAHAGASRCRKGPGARIDSVRRCRPKRAAQRPSKKRPGGRFLRAPRMASERYRQHHVFHRRYGCPQGAVAWRGGCTGANAAAHEFVVGVNLPLLQRQRQGQPITHRAGPGNGWIGGRAGGRQVDIHETGATPWMDETRGSGAGVAGGSRMSQCNNRPDVPQARRGWAKLKRRSRRIFHASQRNTV